ncbi:MAG: hypothetical protein HGN29_16765 [Asgard group archaeon]|nr:hypothetical protein [Asgard group archaeon]
MFEKEGSYQSKISPPSSWFYLCLMSLITVPISFVLLITIIIVRFYVVGRISKGPAPPPNDVSRRRLSNLAVERQTAY